MEGERVREEGAHDKRGGGGGGCGLVLWTKEAG